jgi:peptidoglycan/LPS O-acetylase OafA/YrhL
MAFAIYAVVRISALGDAAPYDSVALFAYAAPLCLLALAARPASAPLAFIGSGSYFIYLWHIFPIMLLRGSDTWRQADPALASFAAYAAAAIGSIAALIAVRAVLPQRAAQWLGA